MNYAQKVMWSESYTENFIKASLHLCTAYHVPVSGDVLTKMDERSFGILLWSLVRG